MDHRPEETAVYKTEIVLPQHSNALGTIFGGTLVAWADIAAAIAAQKHARSPAVVTASFDQIHFIAPIRVGQITHVKAMVNRAWGSSMEVGVRIESEDPENGKMTHTTSAYATFVALDKKGRPCKVGKILPQSAEEKQRYEEAGHRKESRLKLAEDIKFKRRKS